MKLYQSYGMIVSAPSIDTLQVEDRYGGLQVRTGDSDADAQRLFELTRDERVELATRSYFSALESQWSADIFR